MKRNLAVFWAAIVAAGVTLVGVVTGRRRRARAERQKAREERRAKRAQRRAQGGRKRAGAVAARTGGRAGASATATPATAGKKKAAVANASATETADASSAASEATDRASEGAPEPARDASAAPAEPASEAEGTGDDLQAIKGLGAVAAGKLREAGVTTYAQIAAWTPEEARDIALRLELQPGRIAGDDWVGQARHLVDQGRDQA